MQEKSYFYDYFRPSALPITDSLIIEWMKWTVRPKEGFASSVQSLEEKWFGLISAAHSLNLANFKKFLVCICLITFFYWSIYACAQFVCEILFIYRANWILIYVSVLTSCCVFCLWTYKKRISLIPPAAPAAGMLFTFYYLQNTCAIYGKTNHSMV